jgi:hypothetical protein
LTTIGQHHVEPTPLIASAPSLCTRVDPSAPWTTTNDHANKGYGALALIENWMSSWTNGVQGRVILHGDIDGLGLVVVNGKDKALRGTGPG